MDRAGQGAPGSEGCEQKESRGYSEQVLIEGVRGEEPRVATEDLLTTEDA